MARQQRVVWHEGMNLDPHHFQQADRYHQAALNFRARALQRYDWGFLELKIDSDALAQGQLALEKCKGLTEDGLMFDMAAAGGDRLPKPRAMAPAFTPTATKLDVYLAIRAERPSGFNCRIDDEARDAADNRFTMERRELLDDNTGTNSRPIGVARPNFVLRFAEEPLDEFSALKIAEVVRSATAGFELSKTFIPPCLSLAAADNLMNLGNDLLGQLVRLSNQQRGALPFGKKDVTVADLTGLWLAQTINPFIALLKHRLETSRCHPEVLYTDLLMLAGQLTTNPSPLGILPTGFPAYEHNNLAKCFTTLDRLIRELLKVEVQRPYVEIILQKRGETLWSSETIDEKLLQSERLYLAAGGNVEQNKITKELMDKLKIATPEGIHALAAATSNGLRAVYSPRIPPGLPDNLHYFQLEKTGFFWEAIVASRGLAILVPAEFAKLELKLLAIKP